MGTRTMKYCKQCGRQSPRSAQICACGYSFATEDIRCPNCQSIKLEEIGLADAEGRFVAGLLGGRNLRYLFYGPPAVEIRCTQCGFKFEEEIRRRWKIWDYLGIVIGLAIILAFVIF